MTGPAVRVFDGEIDEFMEGYLRWKRAEAVADAVHDIFCRLYPGASWQPLRRAFKDFDDLFRGRMPGYLGCDTVYHDIQHTLDGVLALAATRGDGVTGDDITRSILLQIIVEQEEKGQPMLSTRLLEQIILYYGDTLQSFVGTYLEKSMDAFIRQQQVLQDQMESMLEMAPSSVFRDMAERNLQLWKSMQDNLMKVYVPGGGTDQADSKKKG